MSKYGHYTVGDKIITNSILAFLEKSKTGLPIKWHYYDDIWKNFDKSLLGRTKLKELYKQRAQMLRDSYDYLILQYSGGSDSHCILQAFLQNNIKLDQVMVKQPFNLINQKIHNPNVIDTSARNQLSEWDYVIKPDLEYISKYHPDIEIKLIDWLDGVTADSFKDDKFQSHRGLYFMSYILKHPEYSNNDIEIKLIEQGKKVGVINGVEKPVLLAKDNKAYTTFPDKPMVLIPPTLTNPYGTEYFFWTPDFPELALERAYQVFLWFKRNPQYQDLLYKPKWIGRHTERWDKYSELIKPIIYPDWDISKFQVKKPIVGELDDMSQFDIVVETHPEIIEIKKGWRYHWDSYLKELDTTNVVMKNGQFPSVDSSYYYMGNLID